MNRVDEATIMKGHDQVADAGALAGPLPLCYSANSRALTPLRRSGVSGRGVAQPGSAPGSGPGGRRFKSSRPDQSFQEVT